MTRFGAIFLGVWLVGGCTPMVWQHPGLHPAAVAEIRGECKHYSENEAFRLSLYYDQLDYARPRWSYDRNGRRVRRFEPYPDSLSRRWNLENRLFDDCMRQHGFRLVPGRQ
jgi:hypothetical protein